MNRVSAPVRVFLPIYHLQIDHLQVHLQTRSIIASKCISNLAQSQPPIRTMNCLQTRLITASKCIFQFTRSRAVSASANSIYHGLQVHLSVHSISASKCISTLARSRPLSSLEEWLPSSLDEWPPNSFDYCLQVHFSVHLISVPKCISKLALLWPPSASLSSLDLGLQVHLQTCSITAFKFTR